MGLVSFAQYEALLGKYDALVQVVAQMKREGFAVPESPAQPVSLAADLPQRVRATIASICEPSSQTYRHLVKQALEMQALGVEEGDIVTRIERGEPVEL